ncbi:MAG: class I SAM-dependent methyltransferase [Saprospiraceae bacterium]
MINESNSAAQVGENFWIANPLDYTEITSAITSKVTHPIIVEIVNDLKPYYFLDFGCGDGRMAEMLDPTIPISIYDISQEMLAQAKQRLNGRIERSYEFLDEIPNNHFDVVVCSMVLLCIDNIEEFTSAMKKMCTALNKNGKLIILNTHPCFMQSKFSVSFTSYSKGKPFFYFNEGDPYDITIQDFDKKKQVTFEDYHWTLSFIINKMIEVGLKIESMIETSDDLTMKNHNAQHSPCVILTASKNEK